MAEAQARRTQGYQLNSQGNQCFMQRNYECAVSAYEQALSYLPNDPSVLSNLKRAKAGVHYAEGLAYHKNGDWQNAIVSYKRALQYESNSLAIRQNLRKAESGQRTEQNTQREKMLQDQMAFTSREIISSSDQLVQDLKNQTSPAASSENAAAALNQVKVPLEPFKAANRENPELFKTTKAKWDPNQPEGSKKAGDHIRSALAHGTYGAGLSTNEGSSEELSKAFDTGGKSHGSLGAVEIKAEGMGAEALQVSDELKKHPEMTSLADRWNKAGIMQKKNQSALDRLEAKDEKTSADYVAIANARAEVNKAENEKNFIQYKVREAESSKSPANAGKTPAPGPDPAPAKAPAKTKMRRVVLDD